MIQFHPDVAFLGGWDIWHSESHWSMHHPVKRYVQKVLQLYVDKVKMELNLPESQRALLIFDVYAAN